MKECSQASPSLHADITSGELLQKRSYCQDNNITTELNNVLTNVFKTRQSPTCRSIS